MQERAAMLRMSRNRTWGNGTRASAPQLPNPFACGSLGEPRQLRAAATRGSKPCREEWLNGRANRDGMGCFGLRPDFRAAEGNGGRGARVAGAERLRARAGRGMRG